MIERSVTRQAILYTVELSVRSIYTPQPKTQLILIFWLRACVKLRTLSLERVVCPRLRSQTSGPSFTLLPRLQAKWGEWSEKEWRTEVSNFTTDHNRLRIYLYVYLYIRTSDTQTLILLSVLMHVPPWLSHNAAENKHSKPFTWASIMKDMIT